MLIVAEQGEELGNIFSVAGVPAWGLTPCASYYLKGEQLMAVFKDKHSTAAKHVEGNKIGSF